MPETNDHWGEVLDKIREGWLAARAIDGRARQVRAMASLAEVHLAMLVGHAHELRAEVAALRQQLDEARARANEAARLSADARDRADALAKEYGTLSEFAGILERDRSARDKWGLDVAARHGISEGMDDPWGDILGVYGMIAEHIDALTARVAAAEADRDRLLVVYRAAEAWAGAVRLVQAVSPTMLSEPSKELLAALDTAATWTPAKDGDTPGELVPGEGEAPQPIEVCGTECARPAHEPNWDLDYLDFPTAWWIQEQGFGHTDERCSAVQSNGALLCDCGAVEADWKRLRAAYRAGAPAEAPQSDDDREAERRHAEATRPTDGRAYSWKRGRWVLIPEGDPDTAEAPDGERP